MDTIPLLSHHRPDEIFCWQADGAISVGRYLLEARQLANILTKKHPDKKHLINLSQNNYHFALGFAAGIMCKMKSLQPSSTALGMLKYLYDQYPDLLILNDSDEQDFCELPMMVFPKFCEVNVLNNASQTLDIPQINYEQSVAVLFTSGSTGKPQAQKRYWNHLTQSCLAEMVLLGINKHSHNVVATVPIQHSYGFESIMLLAMHGKAPFWSGKTFYPQDICSALNSIPRPRMLVTTPYHLKILLSSEVEIPVIDICVSATAPLPLSLAKLAEEQFSAPLWEIYGATETGQLATRHLTQSPKWTLFPDIDLEINDGVAIVHGKNINGKVALGDKIEKLSASQFLLQGRLADMVNLAGKRTSINYLNHQLCAIEGVEDGVFFQPQVSDDVAINRLVAFVVSPTLTVPKLKKALNECIDSIFMPRPLILLESLPRESTGKITREALLKLYEQYVSYK